MWNWSDWYAKTFLGERWTHTVDRMDLSMSGPLPSGGGNPVCGGWGGRPAGMGGSVGRVGPAGHATHTPCLITLHALQDHSKSELEYLHRHDKSFHASYLRYRYENAYRLNLWYGYSNETPNNSSSRATEDAARRWLVARAWPLSFCASSLTCFSSAGSAAGSWRNWWRRNCSRWSGPTGDRGVCSPRVSAQRRRRCDTWSTATKQKKKRAK